MKVFWLVLKEGSILVLEVLGGLCSRNSLVFLTLEEALEVSLFSPLGGGASYSLRDVLTSFDHSKCLSYGNSS